MDTFVFTIPPNQTPETEDLELADVKRFFLSPEQVQYYREKEPLLELLDTKSDGGLHINITTINNPKVRTYIGHACMLDGEELNIAYVFLTILPNLVVLEKMIRQDFETYILTLREKQHDTIH